MKKKTPKTKVNFHYDHSKIEKKWQKEWERKKLYKTKEDPKKKKFYVLDMFPYPSGEGLHVGHPKGYIATDVVSRMKRMQGFNVLHPMGFDAFGLPAEQYAIQMKTNPAVAVAKNVQRYKEQLEILGFDYDWSREVITTDPGFYKWTQWIFLELFKKGLAYEAYQPINWCPMDKTGLANEDVENGRCERCGASVEKRMMKQWVLKITDYAERLLEDLDAKDKTGRPLLDWPESIKESQRNWIGRSEGAILKFLISNFQFSIEVFTTRPDTLFGATYLVLAPELFEQLKNQNSEFTDAIQNQKEAKNYILKTRTKTEIDRTDATKEKTGVELKGIQAINPANKEKIPVWIADYVLPDYGTGAIMAVPGHDERDFEFAKKFNLPIKFVVAEFYEDQNEKPVPGLKTTMREVVHVVLFNKKKEVMCLDWPEFKWKTFIIGGIEDGETIEEATKREIKEETGYTDVRIKRIAGNEAASFYAAHKKENRIAYATVVVAELQSEAKVDISEKESSLHKMYWISTKEVPNFVNLRSQQSDWKLAQSEIYTGEGILVNSDKFSHLSTEEAKKEITEFVRGKWTTKYKLKDWVFSRQRYWGEPLPVLHGENGEIVPVSEKDLPVKLPKVKYYEPTGTGESPLANIPDWVNVKIGKKKYKRETNTMPQWAGSSWYYLRYKDPQNSKKIIDSEKENYWKEVDLYVGGAEHATRHLIYARFWHKFLYDIGVVSTIEPFYKFRPVGLILAEDGKKMSKRWGNVVNPDDVVKKLGADTLRVYEMFMGPFDQSIAWSINSMIGARRFIERVWKLQNKLDSRLRGNDGKKIKSLLHKTIKKVGDDIMSMRFNTAISSLMILLNEFDKEENISEDDYKTFLLLLAPFAPHLTEELWNLSGNKKSIHLEKWPSFDSKIIEDQETTIAVQINGKTRGIIKVSADQTEDAIKEKAKKLPELQKWLGNKAINKVIYVKNRIINIVIDER